jgi:hypothetical protein
MSTSGPRKVVRSYRLVFRRRWRIFRIQNWRIPLPGGLELRLVGYWLVCLATLALLSRLPLLGTVVAAMPASLRLLALPIAAAWGLARWEVDGRAAHRALAGLFGWWLRPRVLCAGRRCPAPGAMLAPLGELALAPDLRGPRYPRGRLAGPARILLRYPVAVEPQSGWRRGRAASRALAAPRWRLRPSGSEPLHRGKTVFVPEGRTLLFEPGEGR